MTIGQGRKHVAGESQRRETRHLSALNRYTPAKESEHKENNRNTQGTNASWFEQTRNLRNETKQDTVAGRVTRALRSRLSFCKLESPMSDSSKID